MRRAPSADDGRARRRRDRVPSPTRIAKGSASAGRPSRGGGEAAAGARTPEPKRGEDTKYHYYVSGGRSSSYAVFVCDHAYDCEPLCREASEQEVMALIGTDALRATQDECAWNGLGSKLRGYRSGRKVYVVEYRGPGAKGGAKVDHGSGGTVPLRRSKTLPVCEPFPVTGRVGRFIPWSCIARSVWRAGTG